MTAISWDIAIGVAFAVGVLLFGISSAMLRSARPQPAAQLPAPQTPAPLAVPPPSWARLVDEDLAAADRDLRMDMIERLGIVRSPWSREVLLHARSEELDPELLSAIDRALRDADRHEL